jgi:hypothetical protein
MPNLILIGHLEQAPGDSSNRLFGLTLSAGWSEDTAPPHPSAGATHPLFPWTWNRIQKIQLLGKNSNGQWVAIKQYDAIDPASLALNSLRASAHARYQEAGISVKWPDPTATAAIQPLTVNNGAAPWTAQLVELSTSPYPIAQNLNLSFVYRVPQADLVSYSQLAAVPVMAQDLNGAAPMQFGAFQETTASGFLPYTNVGSLTYGVVATCNLIATALPATNSDWNPQIQRIPLTSASITDWQANFLISASRLFSLPDFLHFLVTKPNAGLDAKFIPTMLDAGVASLRDAIGLGTALGPLAAFADLQPIMQSNSGLVAETRNAAYKNAFPALVPWKTFLAQRLPKQTDAVIWTSSSKDSFTLPDAARADHIARLTREFAAVLALIGQDDETTTFHRDLMLAHWDATLGAMTQTPQAQRDAFRGAVAGQLNSRRFYQPAWLDDLAGLFWANILASTDSGDNPYLNRLRALSTFFLLNRLGISLTAAETPTNLPNGWDWRNPPTDWLPTGQNLTAWQNLKKYFQDNIKDWQDTIAAGFAPDSAILDPSARNPQPLHLQFATFSKDPASPGSVDVGNNDFFRSIRGVGLLVREQSSGPWYNVNRNGMADSGGQLLYPTPVGIAQRPVYLAELRRSLLSYDSAPGAGGTALDNIKQLEKVMESADTVRDPLLHSTYHDNAQAVQLKYGRTFQFVSFGVLNSGIVPPEIRPNTNEPRAWAATVANSSSELLRQPRSYTYQRTTRIGALRILADKSLPKSKQSLPVIPEGTFPRGRDLPWPALWASLPSNVQPADQSLPLALVTPSKWIGGGSPAQSSYAFGVNLPEVTWKEWACWGASLPSRSTGTGLPSGVIVPLDSTAFAQDREDIIAEAFEQCLPAGADPSFLPAVDDPCLERMFYFELFQEIDGILQLVKSASLRIPDAAGTSGLRKYQSVGATVLCKHAETAASDMAPNAAAKTMTVQVEAGQVCLLRIWGCVPAEYQASATNRYAAMFAPNILPQSVPATLDGRKYFLVSPHSLILEGASDVLPTGDDLFRAFSTGYELDQSDYTKSFASARLRAQVVATPATRGAKFQGTPMDPGYRFLNIGRAEVQRQSWRWDGRPVPLHPVLRNIPAANFADEEQKWIARVYGEVPDRESLKCRMVISKTASTDSNVTSLDRRGCRFFEYSEVLGNSAGAVKADQDDRGAHYRFTLRAFSRYESLLAFVPGANAVRYAHPAPDFVIPNSQLPRSFAWKNVFIPSRVMAPETPRIRVVLPLTEAYERTESQSPGLLAVFDDIWYDGAGLGESLEAEIEQIQYAGDNYQQAGKDVLLRGTNELPSLPKFSDPSSPPAMINLSSEEPHPKWAGPVGHYKDFDNRAARFLGSSFVIPAPSKIGGSADARNWLASLRFRRVVYSRALPPQAAAGSASMRVSYSGAAMLGWTGATRRSGWTDPYWVPLLPEFSRFDDFSSGDHRIANLSARIEPATGAVTLTQGVNGPVVRLKPTQSPLHPDGFRLYAILTQRAYDFRGQYNQEVYVATLAQQVGTGNWLSTSRAANIQGITAEYRVRIIEVQLPTARVPGGAWPTDPEDIWDAMSGVKWSANADASDDSGVRRHSAYDALGRIVRYSEPANSVPRALCEISEVKI